MTATTTATTTNSSQFRFVLFKNNEEHVTRLRQNAGRLEQLKDEGKRQIIFWRNAKNIFFFVKILFSSSVFTRLSSFIAGYFFRF